MLNRRDKKSLKANLFLLSALAAAIALSACAPPMGNGATIDCPKNRTGLETAQMATAAVAKLAYIHRTPDGKDKEYSIVIRNLSGSGGEAQNVLEVGADKAPTSVALFPSGDEVAYIRNNDIYRKKIGGSEVRLTNSASTIKSDLILSADQRLFFSMAFTYASPRQCGEYEPPYDCYEYGITDGSCCDLRNGRAIYHLALESGAQPVREEKLGEDKANLQAPAVKADGKRMAYRGIELSDASHSHLKEKQEDGRLLTLTNDAVFHTIDRPVYLSPTSDQIYFIGGSISNDRHGIYRTTSGDLSKSSAVKLGGDKDFHGLAASPDGNNLIVAQKQSGSDKNPLNLYLCPLDFSNCQALTSDTALEASNTSPATALIGGSTPDPDPNNPDPNNDPAGDDCSY